MLSKKIEWCLIVLVILNVLAITLGTVEEIQFAYKNILDMFESFCVFVFAFEYIIRLRRAPILPQYSGHHGRLRYVFSTYALIDLAAIAPYGLAFLLGTNSNASLLRILRILTIFRLAKLLRYQKALHLIMGVLKAKSPELVVCGILILLFVFISGSLLFILEHDAQPQVFSSIPASLWWSVVSVTTIGYGDIVPTTTIGKFVSGLLAFAGVALIAIPTSIIAGGFIEATSAKNREKFSESHIPKNTST